MRPSSASSRGHLTGCNALESQYRNSYASNIKASFIYQIHKQIYNEFLPDPFLENIFTCKLMGISAQFIYDFSYPGAKGIFKKKTIDQ